MGFASTPPPTPPSVFYCSLIACKPFIVLNYFSKKIPHFLEWIWNLCNASGIEIGGATEKFPPKNALLIITIARIGDLKLRFDLDKAWSVIYRVYLRIFWASQLTKPDSLPPGTLMDIWYQGVYKNRPATTAFCVPFFVTRRRQQLLHTSIIINWNGERRKRRLKASQAIKFRQ